MKKMGLLLLVFLSACTKSGSGGVPDAGLPNPASPQPETGLIVDSLKDASVYCSGGCTDNVGLVVINLKAVDQYLSIENIAQCTGTLVAADVVLTNSHCIPPELKTNAYGQCHDYLGFRLPTGDYATCKEVIFFSEIPTDETESNKFTGPDYALFRISHPLTVSIAKISHKGFDNMKIYHVYSVDPTTPGYLSPNGVIRRKDCTAVYGSMLAPTFNSNLSQTASFFGDSCDVIGGNSGSAIRDESENVLGVMNKGHKNDPFQALRLPGFTGPTLPQWFGLGVNFACLPLKGIDEKLPDACAHVTATATTSPIDTDALKPQLLEKITGFATKLPPYILYKVKLDTGMADTSQGEVSAFNVLATPVCVRPQSMWPANTPIEHRSHALFFKEDHLSFLKPEYHVGMYLSTDEYVRPKVDIRDSDLGDADEDLNISKIGEPGNLTESMTISGIFSKTITVPMTVGWCTTEQAKQPFVPDTSSEK